jgi:hypothetical protein
MDGIKIVSCCRSRFQMVSELVELSNFYIAMQYSIAGLKIVRQEATTNFISISMQL